MAQCLDRIKHFCAAVASCCGADLYKQPRGLEDPEALAGETVCMLHLCIKFEVLIRELLQYSYYRLVCLWKLIVLQLLLTCSHAYDVLHASTSYGCYNFS